MKITGIIVLLLSCFCSLSSLAEEPSAPFALPESLTLVDKEWKVGYKDENVNSKIVEYVANNESVNKWSELFTVQKYKYTFPKEVTPIAFAEKEIEFLKAKNYKYVYKAIESTPQEALIELKITSPIEQQQDELQRIIRTSDDQLVILHYGVRKNDMGDEQREKWLRTLKEFK